ncbi:hypothetical protein BB561_005982 [Smittium simulii]|uniref:Inhibitor I9 domain-containing protein n=1 Tax=Smittium simulii TaxID=133385 RepID=A0A2T9Y773_9FUNG|nr:hypothetical protein BB561_005982 [Smittium simulii]
MNLTLSYLFLFFCVFQSVFCEVDKTCLPFIKECKTIKKDNCSKCINTVKPYNIVLLPSTKGSQKDQVSANSKILQDHITWIKEKISKYPNKVSCCTVDKNAPKIQFSKSYTINKMIGYTASLNQNLVATLCERSDIDFVEEDKKIFAF